MKVAIYCRVSTTEQAQEGMSIAAQRNLLRQYALQHGYEIVEEFVDEGASARTADRPEFQRMIAMAKQKPAPFQAIIVHKFDRFARNREDSVVYKNLLRRECDIDVVSITEPVDDSPVSHLMEGILEVMAEFYSLNLAQEVKKGMTEAATQGRALGETPLGYKIGEDGRLEIVPDQAAVVKWIYAQYVEHETGMWSISKALRERGVEMFGDAGGLYKWSSPGVRVILTNRAYVGDLVWGKRDTSRGHKVRDEEEWIVAKDAHEPIIDRPTWEETQRRIEANYRPLRSGRDYLLHGLIRCLDCGSAMGQFTERWKRKDGTKGERRLLRCNYYQNTGGCYFNNIGMRDVEQQLFSFLRGIVAGKVDADRIEVAPADGPTLADQTAELERQLQACGAKFERQVQAYEAGVLNLDELAKAKERVEREKADIQRRLDSIRAQGHRAAIDLRLLRKRLGAAIKIITDEDLSPLERRKALGAVVDHVAYSKRQDRLDVLFRALQD